MSEHDSESKKNSSTTDYNVEFENDEFDEIYNSLNKKDRKDLFEYDKNGKLIAKFSKIKTMINSSYR